MHCSNFIAVEGDWPPCQRINQFVNGKTAINSYETLSSFNLEEVVRLSSDWFITHLDLSKDKKATEIHP